jgi:lysophospholipid acyltransferase (LPLAT)-like uncharacterized protein
MLSSRCDVPRAIGGLMKSLLRSRLALIVIPRVLGAYLWVVLRTNRWTFDGLANFAPHAAGAPAVFSFWHEHLPLMPALAMLAKRLPNYRPTPIHALVSQHRDGQFVGEVVRSFGIKPVLGSSSRGGARSLHQLLRIIKNGAMIGITPDGPRGPRRVAAFGVVQLAAISGAPILPCAARTSRRICTKTWDRMGIPLPFGRGVVVCGAAINVPREAWREALPGITAAMNKVTERADLLSSNG